MGKRILPRLTFSKYFLKTTMGISKKTEILQTTENSEPTEILKANDCARALAKNLTASNKLAVKGEALLKAIDKTDIPDKMLEEIKKYHNDAPIHDDLANAFEL